MSVQSEAIQAGSDGTWIDCQDLRAKLMEQIGRDANPDSAFQQKPANSNESIVTVDLTGLQHLDADALQVLLAAELELRGSGRLELTGCCDLLHRWFGYAGADEFLKRNCPSNPAESFAQ